MANNAILNRRVQWNEPTGMSEHSRVLDIGQQFDIQWAQGLRFVQWKKNTRFHSGTGRTPYEAMYGHKAFRSIACPRGSPRFLTG